MKGEIPVCTRCCFCLPLRYGLLAWGYFKLIADAFIIVILTFMFINILYAMNLSTSTQYYIDQLNTEMTISIITDVIFLTDFVVTIVFIIGGHKKNVKLIRVFYFLSIGMWVATVLLVCLTAVASLYVLFTAEHIYHFLQIFYTLLPFCFFLISLIVQTYFLMLLRSEIIKLRNSGEFRFVNNAAEAMCTMECKEVVTEVVKPDD